MATNLRSKKNKLNAVNASNIVQVHKDYLVQVTLKNGNVYDLIFRRETDTIKQRTIFQTQWDHELWAHVPKMVRLKNVPQHQDQ